MVSRMTSLLVVFALLFCMVGCSAFKKPPIESFADKLADEAIIPAVKGGLAQGIEQLSIQAGAQGINPTYVVKFAGKWVTGIEGQASVGVEGVAGQLQVSSASSDKTRTSPHPQPQQNQSASRPSGVSP